jgi:molybdopterin converting factor small subunit
VRVRVQLFATLSAFLPEHTEGDTAAVALNDGATVDHLMRLLNIPAGFPCLVVVNGRDAEPERILAEGDTVTLFPPLAGG